MVVTVSVDVYTYVGPIVLHRSIENRSKRVCGTIRYYKAVPCRIRPRKNSTIHLVEIILLFQLPCDNVQQCKVHTDSYSSTALLIGNIWTSRYRDPRFIPPR